MNGPVVVYSSKYGSTQRYAEWIAEALGCPLRKAADTRIEDLLAHDPIVYGGGLYASGINGVSLITKNYERLQGKTLIVFTVGLADPAIEEQFEPILSKNFSPAMREHIRIFHLRGGIDYRRLGMLHKSMMAMLKKMVDKKPEADRTDEDREMLATYGAVVDFTDPASIGPLVAAAQDSRRRKIT